MNLCIHRRGRESGYVLLVLLLTMTLLLIGFLAMVEGIEFQIKRDREQEFIHRGLEYSRAVRRYVKDHGRYPTSLEALENSNHVRYLRKRYKDPITGKNFKLLYYGDLETFHPNPRPSPPAPSASQGVSRPIAQTNSDLQADGSPTSPSDTPQADQTASSQAETPTPPADGQAEATEEIDGGRAIVGVTSYNKNESIRVFNGKNHYNQWKFVYDPGTDTGLMKGPNQTLPRQVQSLQDGQDSNSGSGVSR